MASTEQRERELKFDVPTGWTLPDLSEFGTIEPGSAELESTYFDTDARDLLANRLTLRRRTGSTDEGWQLKVPERGARTEVRVPLNGMGTPHEVQQLTLGLRRGAPLRPIAIVRTRRDIRVIAAATGTPLAEVVLDDVTSSTLGDATTVTSWREAEVELKNGDERLLRRVAKWLVKNGATPSRSSSKLARAVGSLPARASTSDPVVAYLARQYDAILAGDLALRRGRDAIHKTRVATRRYRSVLRVFAARLDPERTAALDTELKWYAAVLGDVRDLQVMRAQLTSDLHDLPPELLLGPVSARLSETLAADLADATRRLEAALGSERYLALLEELRRWRIAPPVLAGGTSRKALAERLETAERKYRKRLAAAEALDNGDESKNAAMHSARKAAKRARYTAELAMPKLGRSAKRARKRAKAVQGRLGERQDAVVAADFLRRLGAQAGASPGENGFTYGVLLGRELDRGGMHLG